MSEPQRDVQQGPSSSELLQSVRYALDALLEEDAILAQSSNPRQATRTALRAGINTIQALVTELDTVTNQAALSGWQPIETAPKDGSMFLSCRGSEDGPLVVITCWYGKRHGYWLTLHDTVIQPTHWMPLPAAPDAQKPGE